MEYIVKRIGVALFSIVGILVITFILMKSVPGDPVYGMIGQHAGPEVIEQYRKKLGVDENYLTQFFQYVGLVAKGDLGKSYYTQYPVSRSIMEKLPNTLKLASAAMAFAVLLGVCIGIIAAYFKNSAIDRAITLFSSVGISIPIFWFGLILIFIFAYTFKILPPSGMGHGQLIYIILPAVTLGSRSLAFIARVTRSSMIEVLHENYITSARAKGISEIRVVLRHGLRNAIIPVITLIGIDFASYLNGSVLTETIFGWDGLGRFAMSAIFKRDYPVILGTVLFGAVIFVSMNFIIDILYKVCNPKIKLK
ncbi:MAG: ABC transporter permease [Candidatus Ancaeobacter aquaticus]|nr:ABC transporter permease [Candidatus Ancaeobacter aquaticus]